MSKRITARRIDAILPFLGIFEGERFKAGEGIKRESPGQLPWVEWSQTVSRFVEVLYENGWITSFDWPSWQDQATQYVESPERVASADLETIRRLFTLHVRKDRFCEGHLVGMFESGHIVVVLRRLKALRAAIPERRKRRLT